MKQMTAAIFAICIMGAPAFAAGDVGKGEKTFGKCKSCHMIVSDDGTQIVKGGKTGPNLYGVIGRQAGTVEGFRYGADLVAAGEAGLIWDETLLAEFVKDPRGFLKTQLNSSKAKSKMSLKLKSGGEDIAAYLASLSAE
jgi:cytochrome c